MATSCKVTVRMGPGCTCEHHGRATNKMTRRTRNPVDGIWRAYVCHSTHEVASMHMCHNYGNQVSCRQKPSCTVWLRAIMHAAVVFSMLSKFHWTSCVLQMAQAWTFWAWTFVNPLPNFPVCTQGVFGKKNIEPTTSFVATYPSNVGSSHWSKKAYSENYSSAFTSAYGRKHLCGQNRQSREINKIASQRFNGFAVNKKFVFLDKVCTFCQFITKLVVKCSQYSRKIACPIINVGSYSALILPRRGASARACVCVCVRVRVCVCVCVCVHSLCKLTWGIAMYKNWLNAV